MDFQTFSMEFSLKLCQTVVWRFGLHVSQQASVPAIAGRRQPAWLELCVPIHPNSGMASMNHVTNIFLFVKFMMQSNP